MTVASPALCALALGALAGALPDPPGAPAPEHFGRHLVSLAGLRGPEAAAFGPGGDLWVADTGHHRIVVFAADGLRRLAFGGRGTGRGELLRPAGIACARDGRVFVSDTGNHRVQVFDQAGVWLSAFAARGRGPGELCEPRGLALDSQRLLVADSGNARIAAWSLEGTPLGPLAGADELRRPIDVSLDALGRVWVADELGCRILRLDPAGEAPWSFGGRGAPFGLFAGPAGLGFLGTRLFVSDRFNHRVQEFDLSGRFQSSFPAPAFAPHASEGALFAPGGLAASPDGTRLAVCEPLEDRVQVFGERTAQDEGAAHELHAGVDESLARVSAGAASSAELAAWIDPETRSVDVRSEGEIDLAPLTRLGARGGLGFDLVEPRDVAIDAQRGWIHVSDAGRIWTFALRPGAGRNGFDPLAARLVRYAEFGAPSGEGPLAGLAWAFDPGPLVVLPGGGLLVADLRNAVLVRFDERGRPVEVWPAPGGKRLLRPVELVRRAGRLWVSDADAGRVWILDLSGRPLGRLEHGGDDPLLTPGGLLPLADGRVLVADRERDRVHIFDGEGRHVGSWGGSGVGPAELHQPSALLQGPEGLLRVIDTGNRRGQVLTEQGRFVLSF